MAATGLHTQYLLIRQPEDYNIDTFGLNKPDLVRFLYLASYTDYITGKIVYDNGRTIKRSAINELLNISDRRCRDFINNLINKELLLIINGELFLNKELSKIGFTGNKEYNYIKLHKINFRKIYHSLEVRGLSKLASLYLLLPYLNLYNNSIIGKDNKELSLKDISSIIKYKDGYEANNDLSSVELDGIKVFDIYTNKDDKRTKNMRISTDLIHLKKDDDTYDYNIYSHIRQSKLKNLVDDFTEEQKNELLKRFNYKCAFTGENTKLHVDHVIPVSWEIEGNTLSNMLPLSKYINISKSDKNVFKWYDGNKDNFNVKESMFIDAMTYVASLNNMTFDEYKEYVYYCEQSKDNIDDDTIKDIKNEIDKLIEERKIINDKIKQLKYKLNNYKSCKRK